MKREGGSVAGRCWRAFRSERNDNTYTALWRIEYSELGERVELTFCKDKFETEKNESIWKEDVLEGKLVHESGWLSDAITYTKQC